MKFFASCRAPTNHENHENQESHSRPFCCIFRSLLFAEPQQSLDIFFCNRLRIFISAVSIDFTIFLQFNLLEEKLIKNFSRSKTQIFVNQKKPFHIDPNKKPANYHFYNCHKLTKENSKIK